MKIQKWLTFWATLYTGWEGRHIQLSALAHTTVAYMSISYLKAE